AEHRLERCLTAADRVIAMADGRVACDADPQGFLAWAHDAAPALETPGARLLAATGLTPPPVGVKQARHTLRAAGMLPDARRSLHAEQVQNVEHRPALRVRGVWHEPRHSMPVLRGVELPNAAGKSTLLRHVAGLAEPTRGKISAAGRVALLLQNPNDYLVHEHVSDEAG